MPRKLAQAQIERNTNTRALIDGAEKGNVDEVRRLIPLSDPSAHGSWALQRAAENGHVGCVRLLIPVSNPRADNSRALQWAAANGHAECVEALWRVSDPRACNDDALKMASQRGRVMVCELFCDHLGDQVALPIIREAAEEWVSKKWNCAQATLEWAAARKARGWIEKLEQIALAGSTQP